MNIKPMGLGPDLYQSILLECGTVFYDHPITPFENMITQIAASTDASVIEIIVGINKLAHDELSDNERSCLDWIIRKYNHRHGVF